MNKFVFATVLALGLGVSASSMAQVIYVEGPQPVATYTVCNHGALFAVNRRAIPVAMGGRVMTNNGAVATITRSPDVYIQTKKLVRNAYQSLSADGTCY